MKGKTALINCVILISAVLFVLAALESFIRLTSDIVPWPGYKFYPEAGFLHDKSLKGINSFGFMDVERNIEKPANTFRVILLGDSFVDGQEVATKFEQSLQPKVSDKKVEVIPMGISGTGTVNELIFLEQFGLQLKPDLVVVLFVPNDFANNSNILEAVRLRFHPFKPGRPFLMKTATGIERIPPSLEYQKYSLAELPPHPQQGVLRLPEKFLDKAFGFSQLYQLIRSKLYFLDVDSMYHRFDGEYAYRLSQLWCIPSVQDSLEGWNYPHDLDMDAMFLANGEAIPKAFHDALDYTTFTLKQFKSYARERGFHFLFVATDSCTFFPQSWLDDWKSTGEKLKRTINPSNFTRRVRDVAQKADVDFLDLYPAFSKLRDIRDAHLPNDNHWSPHGQTLAGELMAEDVAARGWLN